MKKLLLSILVTLFPVLAHAEAGALSFAPPPTDVSVIFLGNIFGMVDGVLNGTGSQILGNIFGVFNAAVLALGGIVIIYTLLVSTINTAHEGQMLGQKWSSIWVPVRSTLGLALLIPKASGYCLMQIFFMWVVVQGVGAADKVWDAALSYLNRGGVIIQEQINPITSLTGGGWDIAYGAASILYSQTCMLGLQTSLTATRQGYLNEKSNKSGPCFNTTDPDMDAFCNTPVPDFLGTFNAVTYQTNNPPSSGTYTVSLPNFDSPPYNALNKICGVITWNSLDTSSLTYVDPNNSFFHRDKTTQITGLNSGELETAKLSRAIALQQMYMDLSLIAQVMVSNDPALTPESGSSSTPPFAPFAVEAYGMPVTSSGTTCPNAQLGTGSTCVGWGSSGGNNSSQLFNGTEFQGAIADYNAIMLPTLNLISQAKKNDNANGQRAFIQQASSQGWMLAGSYFFSLASINAANTTTGEGKTTPTDKSSGLGGCKFVISDITKAFTGSVCQGDFKNLCTWYKNNKSLAEVVQSLIDGSPNSTTTAATIPTSSSTTPISTMKEQIGLQSSNAYGFVNNSLMIQLPGQAGTTPPSFVMNVIPSVGIGGFTLPPMNYGCGTVKIIWPFSFCLMKYVGEVIYNVIIVNLFNFFLSLIVDVIDFVVMAFLALPLLGMAQIFNNGVAFIRQPDTNPIIALSNMGINYINFASELWIYLLILAVTTALLGPFAIFVFALMIMALPLLMAWLGTMVAIGFVTAYYVPFLPYMIFTFGSIAWLMAVIEAMVAAPIVALGITHPEGEGPFGKGEQAIMILMNVFLRPSLMIIGYIAGIILSFVSVWVINAGFSNVLPFLQGPGTTGGTFSGFNFQVSAQSLVDGDYSWNSIKDNSIVNGTLGVDTGGSGSTASGTPTGYTGWAGIYAFFFSILIYTTMYLTVVQKSFTLIGILPDKVLRWIGGQPESIGQEASQWAEEAKKQVEGAGGATAKAQGQMGKSLGGEAIKGISKLAPTGPKSTATGGGPSSTESSPEA
jgi:defect in organelle trafficking protein DotA